MSKPIVKYIIQTHFIDGKIKRFEYARESDTFVFSLSGERTKKKTTSQVMCDTWEEARNMLIEIQTSRVARVHSQYNIARNSLKKIKELPEHEKKDKKGS